MLIRSHMTEPVDHEALAALLNANWEYTSAEDKDDAYGVLERFTELGEDGWELVSAQYLAGHWLGVFKRRKIT